MTRERSRREGANPADATVPLTHLYHFILAEGERFDKGRGPEIGSG